MTKVALIEIATGQSRFEEKWKNGKIPWQTLVQKLAKPHRTHETVKEFHSFKKDQRDKIKDIGGFVGGYIAGGRRKSGAVLYRTLLTLDADEADHDFWDVFQCLYGNAALIYSTHSHTREKPRLRLVMPFNRHVEPEEYQAIGRRVAGNLGIEQFDNTGFQDERLMYWPSCSADGEYVYKHQDGPWLDADAVLASYRDWRDTTQWPVSVRVRELIKKSQTKQGDPLEKKGIVGAFCRAYGIEEVIEKYLKDVYEKAPHSEDARYTYVGGSTYGGLVVYDNRFAYSHHGTDPISGKLCNAFDLVRLHLYGDEDTGIDPTTKPTERPSYERMKELAGTDALLREQIGIERLENAREDFAALGIDVDELNTEWLKKLEVDAQGDYAKSIDNIVLVLENDPVLRGCVAYDEFNVCNVIVKPLPWRGIGDDNIWMDSDDAHLRHYLERVYQISGERKIRDGFDVIARKNSFHPIRQYLNDLVWDNTARVDTLLIELFGADDNAYTRAVMRKVLIAAVKRVYKPGSKFDTMLILKGKQGLRKSMFIDVLGGKWYSDTLTTVTGTAAYEQIQGVWFMEMAELAGMRKAEVEQIKHFLSKRYDRFRPAYGRNTVTFLRQCIMIGTSNRDTFIHDNSGARRFWPVELQLKMSDSKLKWLKENRDQIFAEALEYYRSGESTYLSGDLEELAAHAQSKHTEVDDRAALITEYLDKEIPETWDKMTIWQRREFYNNEEMSAEGTVQRKHVTAYDIFSELFGGSPKDFDLRKAREINDILRTIPGWEYRMIKKKYKLFRGFVRISSYVNGQSFLD